MNADKDPYKLLYEQYWLHARHVENERLWFTNIYAALVAGVFVILGRLDLSSHNIELVVRLSFLFLFALSLIGFFLTFSWTAAFTLFSRLAQNLARTAFGIPEKFDRFHYQISKISAGSLFQVFYAVLAGVLLATSISLWPFRQDNFSLILWNEIFWPTFVILVMVIWYGILRPTIAENICKISS